MEKYIFTKKVALGFIKKMATVGEIVSFYKNYAMFQNQKFGQLRDFEICKKFGYLVPAEQYIEPESVEVQNLQKQQDNKFGFKVKKETEQTNIIPLKKFLHPTELNQDQVFVQEDGMIKDNLDNDIHVAESVKKQDQVVEQVKNSSKVDSSLKEENKTDVKKSSQKKTVAKKTTKKSQTVRGMKIIKED